MKKYLGALALMLALLMAAGCSPQQAQTAGKGVFLDIAAESYPLNSENIPYVIINNSGQIINVQMIPQLERETAQGWVTIPTVDVGFCGTPDTVESSREGSLPLAWYGDTLMPGQYRLSFQMVNGSDYAPIELLSDVFALEEPFAPEEAAVWIRTDNTTDMTNLNAYWQADNLQFPTDENARLGVYVRADKNDKGEFLFDDGQDWLVLLKTSHGNYPLFPREYVQLGVVACTVFKDVEDVFHVLVTVRQTAGLRLYDCVFDQQQNAFKVLPVYEAVGINFITASP